ncbi:hypothetical protein EK21DRAFT_104292 [Setomelanomma holmii]|uniref:Uncharacterized protein n=1 Tax=Setomelanomma holmii TaxID=210430 RepID=A0A9P4H1I8_9PLEO|nr:hypothetical protein EK21DRAFT_104292 [Setomelanomma holmii]
MATPRLPFLWPMLFKPLTGPQKSASRFHKRATLSAKPPRKSCRQFATTAHQREEPPTQRYGKAHEPAPHLRDAEAPKESVTKNAEAPKEKSVASEPAHEEADEDEPPTPTTTPSTPSKPSALDDTAPPVRPPDPPKTGDAKPLDSVLHMPSPQDEDSHKPPHLKTPPYVHHFDTYGLVRELSKSTYTDAQSITLMKAVRGILMSNMELAREGLVSKSNVENETYLFRAACSELKTEIGNSRKSAIERMRTERAQLQHEVDILGQRLGQGTGTLKDELKGLFDDRKMAVRQEQRLMETKIQELNYKITVALNSDARSEVEGLRWVLTRRAAITVGVSAFMLFVALRYTSYVQHQQQEERRKKPPKKEPLPEEQHNASTQTNFDSVAGRNEALGGELLAGEGVSLG